MNEKNTLYIDCQFFQTPVWNRGMGRYAVSLLREVFKAMSSDTEFVFIFSKHLPMREEMTSHLKARFPQAAFVNLDLKTTKKKAYNKISELNRNTLQAYIDERAKKEPESRQSFLIACLFQEPTASVFPSGIHKYLIYYDAIPLLYFHRYKSTINYGNYIQRYRTLYEADTVFTISRTVADDLALYLGYNNKEDRLVNLDGAPFEDMLSKISKPTQTIKEPYVLLATSDDIRKNNILAVKAFEQMLHIRNKRYKLVITSSFQKDHREQLKKISPNLIFTGNVTDSELSWLYKNAEAVLFTSEYEGLGLPILEAVNFNKPVACSNIPVFREISSQAFYFFDPLDIEDIAIQLNKALQKKDWQSKLKHYPDIMKRYTWQNSALALKGAVANPRPAPTLGKKLRLAVLAPVPDGYSAIGKLVQELHPRLADDFEVDYYLEDRKGKRLGEVRANFINATSSCFDVKDFNARTYKNYDIVIYHIGNSEYHFDTIRSALYLPGIAILHDTFLNEAFGEMTRLGYMTHKRYQAEELLNQMVGNERTAFLTSLLNNQLAVITHSDYAMDALSPLRLTELELRKAELPVVTPTQSVQDQPREAVHIGLAGILTGRKGVGILKRLATDESLDRQVMLYVFGFSFVEPETVKELKNYRKIRLMTDLTDLEYQTQLSNLDILINYREDYRGETSLTVLEAMRYGTAVIVNGHVGWFSELPDDAVVKAASSKEIMERIQVLVESKSLRRQYGSKARQYAGKHHTPAQYVEVIKRQANRLAGTHKTENQKYADIIRRSNSVRGNLKALKELEADHNG